MLGILPLPPRRLEPNHDDDFRPRPPASAAAENLGGAPGLLFRGRSFLFHGRS